MNRPKMTGGPDLKAWQAYAEAMGDDALAAELSVADDQYARAQRQLLAAREALHDAGVVRRALVWETTIRERITRRKTP